MCGELLVTVKPSGTTQVSLLAVLTTLLSHEESVLKALEILRQLIVSHPVLAVAAKDTAILVPTLHAIVCACCADVREFKSSESSDAVLHAALDLLSVFAAHEETCRKQVIDAAFIPLLCECFSHPLPAIRASALCATRSLRYVTLTQPFCATASHYPR